MHTDLLRCHLFVWCLARYRIDWLVRDMECVGWRTVATA